MFSDKGVSHYNIYKAKGGSNQEGYFIHHKINISDKWWLTCKAISHNKKLRYKPQKELRENSATPIPS